METSHPSHSFISRRWNPTASLDTNGNTRESRRDKECAKTDSIVMDLNSSNDTSQNSSTEWGNICSGGSYILSRGEWHAVWNLNIWQYACKICQICRKKVGKGNYSCKMWKMNNFFSFPFHSTRHEILLVEVWKQSFEVYWLEAVEGTRHIKPPAHLEFESCSRHAWLSICLCCMPYDKLITHLRSPAKHMKQFLGPNRLDEVGNSKQIFFGKLISHFTDQNISRYL